MNIAEWSDRIPGMISVFEMLYCIVSEMYKQTIES